jgi:hypothetical protein
MFNHQLKSIIIIFLVIFIDFKVLCWDVENVDTKAILSIYNDTKFTSQINSFHLELFNDTLVTEGVVNMNIEGQLCYFESFVIDISDSSLILTPCPKGSILLINNPIITQTMQALQFNRKAREKLDFKAIIYKYDSDVDQGLFYQNLHKPLLVANHTVFNELINYSDKTGNFVKLKYSNLDKMLNFSFMYLATMIVLSVCLVLLIWWNLFGFILLRFSVTFMHRVLVLLPYFKFLMSCFILYYLIILKNSYDDGMNKLYFETLISTVSAIYKTLFWFMLLLITNGWFIFTDSIQNFKLSKFICGYLSIYLLVSTDQLLSLTNYDRVYGSYVKLYLT